MENNLGGVLVSSNEEARLENLKKYKILYTKTEPYFDQLAAITATMMNTPIAMINFVDKDVVWTKADQHGQAGKEIERGSSLCSLAILNESVTVYEDLIQNPALVSNPLYLGESGLRFYAAAAITTNEGFRVGAVCIVDKKPRVFGEEDRKKLEKIALMVRLEMNKRIGIS
ncbi:serine/threonine protein kinase [Pedobacter sp. PACM 27299]|uniref:GAF domain-containing protein n=1 Tax=Pedobacter sp. PACM 27299 TaxID=1727164 RepID=UPI000706C0CC|nr:GAF domain-containing protein [Pedobacter sp. PACM 27299]ALL04515.1 serine/threonine protein kinase [Pedobacter sp. PACM 27299]